MDEDERSHEGSSSPAPAPRRRGPGWEALLKLAFLFAPLVVGVIVLRDAPAYLVGFVIVFLSLTVWVAATSLRRCPHCGYLVFAGFGVSPVFLQRCPRCRKDLPGRRGRRGRDAGG